MSESDRYPAGEWRRVARSGAGIGVKMTLLYAIVFVLYAVVRSTIALLRWPSPDEGTAATVLATAASLIVAATSITLLALPISAFAGLVTSLVVYWLRPQWRHWSTGRPLTGFAAATVIVLLVQIALLPVIGLTTFRLQAATYIFWLGLPAIIYIGAIGLGEWRNRPFRGLP
jgi:hypothetical protein